MAWRKDRFDLDYVGPGKWVTMGGEFAVIKKFRPINPMESSQIPAKNRRHIFSVRDLRELKVPGKFYELSPEIHQAARFQDIVPFLKERVEQDEARARAEAEHPTEKPPQIVRVFPELREMREQMLGKVLEEGWSSAKSLFGVRSPLFRAAEMGARIEWNLENGFEGGKRAKWSEPWDKGFGVSVSRSLDYLIGAKTFGSLIFVLDRDEIKKRYQIVPVLSPTARAVIKNEYLATATRKKGPGADVRTHAASLHGAKTIEFENEYALGNEAEERIVAKKVGPGVIKGIILSHHLAWGMALSKEGGLLPNMGLNLEILGVVKKAIGLGIPVVVHGTDAGQVGQKRWKNPSEWNLVKFIHGTDEFYKDKAVGSYEYDGQSLDRPVGFAGQHYWPKDRIG